MSLSAACQAQHAKENAITRKWLLVGFVIAVVTPIGLLPLLRFVLPGTSEPSARISISIVGPADLQGEIVEAASPPKEVFDFINTAEPTATQRPTDSAPLESGSAITSPTAIRSAPLPTQTSESSSNRSSSNRSSSNRSNSNSESAAAETLDRAPADRTEAHATSEALDNTASEQENASGRLIEDEAITTELNTAGATDTTESTFARATASRATQSQAPTQTLIQPQSRGTPTAAVSQASGSNIAARGSSATNQPTSTTESGIDRPGASALGPSIARRRQEPISCRYCDPTALLGETASSGARVEPSVRLEYDSDGNVVGARIERSSGDASVDRAAVNAALTFAFNNPSGESGTIAVDFQINGGNSQSQPSTQETSPGASPATPSNEPTRVNSSEPAAEPTVKPTAASATGPASNQQLVNTQPPDIRGTAASMDATAGAADLADIPSTNLETAPESFEVTSPTTELEPEPTPVPAVAEPPASEPLESEPPASEPPGAEALLSEPDF
ncbi:energy transducer TonB [Synechococcus sp. PCC 7335]|uniref:energy transducer TonB family protein n=1 Tax=Synechococcus sp. (strain ATCC 29403 / PCC 7335) TaxID=91464 RepID=UPI0018DE6CCF|nr:energy transducer TonB [Synechococcus sp. PCC 7335]